MTHIYRLLILFLFGYSGISANAQCDGPDSLIFSRIQADNVAVNWDNGAPASYELEYGISGFAPGNGTVLMTTDTSIAITGLTQDTEYDFYLTSTCADQTTETLGPIDIRTLFFDDVGVTFLEAPTTACDLNSMEAVTFRISNFGQNPQQLFEFGFSVNDEEQPVSPPFDGLYTGIVGFDSTVVTTFDITIDVGEPGEYIFKVWTSLGTDQDKMNDTLEVLVTHQPVIDTYPYEWDFEEWRGGWLIDEENSINTSLDFGRPNSLSIPAAASGENAWVTNLIGPYNQSERSVLISPCFDFSGLTNDPYISCALNFEGEECCDFAIAEISINAGRNWTKIGDGQNGINWYNNDELNRWDGDGVTEGWSRVQNRLFGAAGRDSVRIRYIFESDGSNQADGIGIDDIHIFEPYNVDAAAAVVGHTSDLQCGSNNDQVLVAIENTGLTNLLSMIISYSLNDGATVSESINQLIAPSDRDTIILSDVINTAMDGDYNLKVWVTAPGDEYSFNDTLFTDFQIRSITPLPLVEDFEGSDFPDGWSSTANGDFGIDHMSTSSVFFANLDAGQSFELTTPNVGTLGAMDSLIFDYRIVTTDSGGNTGAVLGDGDNLVVSISDDCGASFMDVMTIDAASHSTSASSQTIKIDLTTFASNDVVVRFSGQSSTGGVFMDLDNINIISCPSDLAVTSSISDATGSAATDGAVMVSATEGTAPYTYSWSTGDSGGSIASLAPGNVMVTVTDDLGCTDQLSFTVGSCVDLGLTFVKSDETSIGNDGTAMVSATAGTAPYTYLWNTGVTTDMIWDLPNGDYEVTVTDDRGCQSTATVTVDLETSDIDIPDLKELQIFPNPTDYLTHVKIQLTSPQPSLLEIYDGLGRRIHTDELHAQNRHSYSINTERWDAGIYFIRVNIGDGAVTRKLIVHRL